MSNPLKTAIMEERKLTEKESLEIITQMIARTKERYIGDGSILQMWGYLVTTVTLLVYLMLTITRQNAWNWLWFAIPLVGFTATRVMARRRQRVCGAVTYSDRISSRLWRVFSISETVLTLLCLGLDLVGGLSCWSAILLFTLIAAPFAEIAQGLIVKEKSLVAGGVMGLALGLVTLLCLAGGAALEASWFLPLFALTFATMMIVPGHILNRKAQHRCKN